ncbi:hypothetical protein P3T16_003036 [Paraburkholderia sp. GAS42]|jgi:hypothetical protein
MQHGHTGRMVSAVSVDRHGASNMVQQRRLMDISIVRRIPFASSSFVTFAMIVGTVMQPLSRQTGVEHGGEQGRSAHDPPGVTS